MVPPGGLADGLMAEAHAENGQLSGKAFDASARNAGFAGRARPGRDDQMRRVQAIDIVGRNLIVAEHPQIEPGIDLPQPLHEVVGEGIVVIDEENHGRRKAEGGRRKAAKKVRLLPTAYRLPTPTLTSRGEVRGSPAAKLAVGKLSCRLARCDAGPRPPAIPSVRAVKTASSRSVE